MFVSELISRLQVCYWSSIRKTCARESAVLHNVHEADIVQIVRENVILKQAPTEALRQLLGLPELSKYIADLENGRDQEAFRRHFRRYLNVYLPDCPFEVSTTSFSDTRGQEASITARRRIKPGEQIKHLTGACIAVSEEEIECLELEHRDFSIVTSSRTNKSSVFLGPARFVNHNCQANARLSAIGANEIGVTATKPIDEGEEITVVYGQHYFGLDNRECLCRTCKKDVQGTQVSMATCEMCRLALAKCSNLCPRCERHNLLYNRPWPRTGDFRW